LGVTQAREDAEQALLDAAERLLISVGYANITTRKLADEAGVNHGLVHYYFGSMQELLLQVLERFTDRLIERQRRMYAAEGPFIDKWRQAMSFIEDDASSGYSKVWFELQALGWNDASIRKRVAQVALTWRRVVSDAFEKAYDEYGIDRKRYPLESIVALVGTFNEGMHLEMLSGIRQGHKALLELIDEWLVAQEKQKRRKR
jgi:AcrR family transcriptional regulator